MILNSDQRIFTFAHIAHTKILCQNDIHYITVNSLMWKCLTYVEICIQEMSSFQFIIMIAEKLENVKRGRERYRQTEGNKKKGRSQRGRESQKKDEFFFKLGINLSLRQVYCVPLVVQHALIYGKGKDLNR